MSVFKDQFTFMQAGEVEQYTEEARALAIDLVSEEFVEFMDENHSEDYLSDITVKTAAVKEALDLIYVTCQWLNVTIGPEKAQECWDALQANNMSKCTNGKLIKREDGKILKPENYKKLDLLPILY